MQTSGGSGNKLAKGPYFIFVDDSRQESPTRPGLGSLVAVGGLIVPGENVRVLEQKIEHICRKTGFPQGEAGEFKWSPDKKHWMREKLVGEERIQFFARVLTTAKSYDARVTQAPSSRTVVGPHLARRARDRDTGPVGPVAFRPPPMSACTSRVGSHVVPIIVYPASWAPITCSP